MKISTEPLNESSSQLPFLNFLVQDPTSHIDNLETVTLRPQNFPNREK